MTISRRTRVAAYALLVEGEKILLCRLSAQVPRHQGKWTLPGGGIEFGERPEEAVVREVREETGLIVTVRSLAAVDSILGEFDGIPSHNIRILYRAEVVGGNLCSELVGSTDLCQWWERTGLPPLVDLVRFAIPVAFPRPATGSDGAGGTPTAALIRRYLHGIASVREAAGGLTPDELRARPAVDSPAAREAGAWSPLEVVCHLADSESLFAERMKRVLAEDRPPLAFADPAAYMSALACDDRDVDEELAAIAAVRQQMSRILSAQPMEAWRRIGIHSRQGEQTLEQLLQKAVDHLEHHVRFLWKKRGRG